MATGPGLNAAKVLQDEGISTMDTGVFSVAQAVACSQAGCLYISPYYNGKRDHSVHNALADLLQFRNANSLEPSTVT